MEEYLSRIGGSANLRALKSAIGGLSRSLLCLALIRGVVSASFGCHLTPLSLRAAGLINSAAVQAEAFRNHF